MESMHLTPLYALTVFVAWICFIRWYRDDIQNYGTALAVGLMCLISAVFWPIIAVVMVFAEFVRWVART